MVADLIMNADDFGRSASVNRAIIRGHCEGVLNSASLMVAGHAFEEAVELARQHPNLRVGLHVVAVDGPAVLSHPLIPHITDANNCFPNHPVRLGLKYAFSKTARAELAGEIEAQFERFADTGLMLDHVDGHQHMHVHPAVFELVLPLAERFGARRIRVVRDSLMPAVRHNRRHLTAKLVAAATFAALARQAHRKLTRTELETSRRTFGLFQSGSMDESYVLSVLEQAQPGDELYFHPNEGERLDRLGPNEQDLQTLLSPPVARAVQAARTRFAKGAGDGSRAESELQVSA